MINVCVTVFNRYDLLARQFRSIAENTVPSRVWIIDRGHQFRRTFEAASCAWSENPNCPREVINVNALDPEGTRGQCLASAWNWFLRNVPDDRLIVGEDVWFGPQAFHNVAASTAGCLGLEDGHSAQFSAFVLRDEVVRQVGFFDEDISPDYVYYEDMDYKHRMALAGMDIAPWYDVRHNHAEDNHGTLGAKTQEQMADHHRRFVIAQNNYIRKWGGLPGHEVQT